MSGSLSHTEITLRSQSCTAFATTRFNYIAAVLSAHSSAKAGYSFTLAGGAAEGSLSHGKGSPGTVLLKSEVLASSLVAYLLVAY